MSDALRRIEKIVTAVIGTYLIARLVLPGNNTAAVIHAANKAFSNSIKVAIGERAIEMRDVPRVEKLLGESGDEIITELFAGLSDSDLDWIEHMLGGAA